MVHLYICLELEIQVDTCLCHKLHRVEQALHLFKGRLLLSFLPSYSSIFKGHRNRRVLLVFLESVRDASRRVGRWDCGKPCAKKGNGFVRKQEALLHICTRKKSSFGLFLPKSAVFQCNCCFGFLWKMKRKLNFPSGP